MLKYYIKLLWIFGTEHKLLHDSQTALPQKLNEKYCDIPESWNRKQRTGSESPGNNEARKRF